MIYVSFQLHIPIERFFSDFFSYCSRWLFWGCEIWIILKIPLWTLVLLELLAVNIFKKTTVIFRDGLDGTAKFVDHWIYSVVISKSHPDISRQHSWKEGSLLAVAKISKLNDALTTSQLSHPTVGQFIVQLIFLPIATLAIISSSNNAHSLLNCPNHVPLIFFYILL